MRTAAGPPGGRRTASWAPSDLGLAYLALDRPPRALEQFRVAADLGASLAAMQRAQANEALSKNDLSKFESHLRDAVQWDSRDLDSYHRLGNLMMQQERWTDAYAVWSDLLRRQPDDPLALGGAVEALRRAGRLPEVAPLVKRLIDLGEDPTRLVQLQQLLSGTVAIR